MITLGFNSKLEIGKIYRKNIATGSSAGYFRGKATFKVMKEATLEEWINDHPELKPAMIEKAKQRLKSGGGIYWVSID